MHLAALAAATARKTAAATARKEAREQYENDHLGFLEEVLAEEPNTSLAVYRHLRNARRCLLAAEAEMCNLEVAMNPDREEGGTVESQAVLRAMFGGVLHPLEELVEGDLYKLLHLAFRDLEN
jgi:hypothetical protein